MAYSVAFFDIDGTLSNPGNALTESARFALEKMGIIEVDEAKLRRFVGPPLEHSFKEYYGFGDEQAKEATAYYRQYMQDKGVKQTVAYDGIKELLEQLKSGGVRLAVVTSKVDYIAHESLRVTGLGEYFEYVGAEKPGRAIKKQVTLEQALSDVGVQSKSEAVMIGDRRHDVEAAHAVDIDSIGVLWGYGTKVELSTEGAVYIASSPSDVARIVLGS